MFVRISKILLLSLLVFFGSSCTSTKVYDKVVAVDRWLVQAQEKSIDAGKFKIVYNERGKGEALLLLHGFGSDKESWNKVLNHIEAPMHIIVPDLPAWGKSTYLVDERYTPEEQARRLDQFREAIGVEKLHIAGISMGGFLAGTYAALFPERVLSLTLIDSAGFTSPKPSDYAKGLAEGLNPLILKKPADVDQLFRYVFYKDQKLPKLVKKAFYEQVAPRAEINEKLFQDLLAQGALLDRLMKNVQVQTQVIWGEQDRIIDVSTTEQILKLKPDADVHILPECGHAPVIEKAEETARLIQSFVFKSTFFPS